MKAFFSITTTHQNKVQENQRLGIANWTIVQESPKRERAAKKVERKLLSFIYFVQH